MLEKIKQEVKKQSDIAQVLLKWKNVMMLTKLYNYKNEILTLTEVEVTKEGFTGKVIIPDGMYIENFKDKIKIIETNFSSVVMIDKYPRKNYFKIRVISSKVLDREIKFKPVVSVDGRPLKPYELYIGNNLLGEPVIINLVKKSHVLLTGANGSGKSKMLDIMLTNHIVNFTKDDILLYLIQLDKSDIIKYALCNQCVEFGESLSQIQDTMTKISDLIRQRKEIIGSYQRMGIVDNYTEFNQLKKGYLPTVLVVFDEMASLMPKKDENDLIKAKKNIINTIVDEIAQYGRSLGIFGIFCLQRPTVNNISSFVKSQSNNIISFRQNNSKSSEVATDDDSLALNLDNRFAVYLNGSSEPVLVKTPFIDIKKVRDKYLKPRYDKAKFLEAKMKVEKINERFEKTPIEKLYTDKELSKMKVVESKGMKSKIKNYVPYKPVTKNDKVIIEENVSTRNAGIGKPNFKKKIGGQL